MDVGLNGNVNHLVGEHVLYYFLVVSPSTLICFARSAFYRVNYFLIVVVGPAVLRQANTPDIESIVQASNPGYIGLANPRKAILITSLLMKHTTFMRKSSNYLTLVLLLSCLIASAQPPIQWQKCFGGIAMETSYQVLQTPDGGYITISTSNSSDGDVTGGHGGDDYWVIKIAANGTIQWEQSYGGSGSDLACAITQVTDGGYVLAGYSNSDDGDVSVNHGGFDFWVLKISATGSVAWQKSMGGSLNDIPTSLCATNDGGVVVGGSTKSDDGDVIGYMDSTDCWLVKLSATGAIVWQRTLGGTGSDGVTSVAQTFDSGYIVAASSRSHDHDVTGNHGDYDAWIVKLDAGGSIQWEHSMGGTEMDVSNDIRQTADSGFIMVGSVLSADGDVTGSHGAFDYWVVRLSATGATEWKKCYGGTDYDYAACVYPALGGGYLVGGRTYSADGDVAGFRGGSDGWIVRIDDTGAVVWQRCLGGTDYDDCAAIMQATDSGIVMAGYAISDDSDVSGNHGGSDVWLVRLAYGTLPTTLAYQQGGNQPVVVYPNPAKELLHVVMNGVPEQICIYDVTGRVVYSKPGGGRREEIDVSTLRPGLYMLCTGDGCMRQFVKQ